MVNHTDDYSVPTPDIVSKTGVHMELIDSIPTMLAGNRPFWGLMYTFDPYEERPYLEAVRSMYKQGIRLFSFLLPLPVAWDQPGKYDFSLLDEVHDQIFQAAPEALVYPRVFMTTPSWWDQLNPEELIVFKGLRPEILPFPHEDRPLWRYETKMYHGTNNASLASLKWRADAAEILTAYVQHTWGKYSGHFFGYQIAYGTCGEWGAFGSYINNRFGVYDFSRPMLRSFRNFLRSKYQTDAALKDAWNDSQVIIDTAEPPAEIQMLQTHLGVFKDPLNCQHYVDWIKHYCGEQHESMQHFCRVVKRAAPVNVLTGVFAGSALLQVGCSAYIWQLAKFALNQLLDSDAIDILSTPNNYEDRSRGVFSQVPIQTIARKKIFFAENDARTFLANRASEQQFSAGKDRTQSIASFKRDTFYNLTQGSGHLWWYDFGLGWYLDKSFEQIVGKLVQQFNNVIPANCQGQAEVALVVDEESLAYTEGSAPYFKLWRESLNEHLPRMGTPFDVITTDDMLQRPSYKIYLFRDMFYTSRGKTKKIRDFVEKADASCVWFYAAGLLGENDINANAIEKLTHIKMNILNFATSQQLTILDFEHPVTNGVQQTQGTAGNEDLRGIYGPMLFVDDDQADILGQIESIKKPGSAFKRQGSRFDAWFASPLLKPRLLANLACQADVHLYVEPGNVIFGCGNVISLQSDINKKIEFKPNSGVEKVKNILTDEIYPCLNGSVMINLIAGNPVLLKLYTI